jgi:hypothetical protein
LKFTSRRPWLCWSEVNWKCKFASRMTGKSARAVSCFFSSRWAVSQIHVSPMLNSMQRELSKDYQHCFARTSYCLFKRKQWLCRQHQPCWGRCAQLSSIRSCDDSSMVTGFFWPENVSNLIIRWNRHDSVMGYASRAWCFFLSLRPRAVISAILVTAWAPVIDNFRRTRFAPIQLNYFDTDVNGERTIWIACNQRMTDDGKIPHREIGIVRIWN